MPVQANCRLLLDKCLTLTDWRPTQASSVSVDERSSHRRPWVQTQICGGLLGEAIAQRAPRRTRHTAWMAENAEF